VLKFHGPLTFANYVGVRRKLDSLPAGSKVMLDFSDCTLIDHTVVQRLHDFEAEFRRGGGEVERVGASHLQNSTKNPFSARLIAPRSDDEPRSDAGLPSETGLTSSSTRLS